MKSILLTFLFIPVFAFCQTYEFDYLLKYKQNRLKPNPEKFEEFYPTIYINSKHGNYSMNSYRINNKTSNWIKDINSKLYYKFDVVVREQLGDLYYYDYAKRFIKEDKENKRFVKRIEVEKVDKLSYIIKSYHKGKKINFIIHLELEKVDANLMYFHFSDMPEFFDETIFKEFKKVLPHENFIIKKLKYDYKNGYIFTEELIEAKKVSKKIILPEGIDEMVTKQFENYKDNL